MAAIARGLHIEGWLSRLLKAKNAPSWLVLAGLYLPFLAIFVATYFVQIPIEWLAPLIGTDFYRSIYDNYLSIEDAYSTFAANQFVTLRLLAIPTVPLLILAGLPLTPAASSYILLKLSFRRIAVLWCMFFTLVWAGVYGTYWSSDALDIARLTTLRATTADGALALYWFLTVASVPMFALFSIWGGLAILRVGWSSRRDEL